MKNETIISHKFTFFAERARFELAVPCGTQTFQACTFGHSDTSPVKNRNAKISKNNGE
jgi:hypothetical protein